MSDQIRKPYIGDQNVKNYLRAQGSSIPLHMAKMRIMGAIASPNAELVPFQVFASFWPEGEFPKFLRREDSEKFFDVFMGLWQKMEDIAREAKAFLVPVEKITSHQEAQLIIQTRLEELEYGFNEGFWGGGDDLPMSSASAALIDHLGHEIDAYGALMQDLENNPDFNERLGAALVQELKARDEVCVDTIQALLLLKSKKNEKAVH